MARIVPDDPKEVKTKAISDAEISWLSNWQTALNRGLPDLARAILETGTDFEHFRANLDENEALWTADQISDLAKYQVAFQANLDTLNPPPPPPPPPSSPIIIPAGTVAMYNVANATAWSNVKVTELSTGQVLLNEMFTDPAQVFANWIPVFPGTNYGIGSFWVDNGRLRSNGGGVLTGLPWGWSAHAWYQSGLAWTDYLLEFEMESMSSDDDDMGCLFRFTDQKTCYRFYWGHQSNDPTVRGRALQRVVGGVPNPPIYLYKDQVGYGYNTGKKKVAIRVNGNTIDISINGVLIVAGKDDPSIVGLQRSSFLLSDPPQSVLLPL